MNQKQNGIVITPAQLEHMTGLVAQRDRISQEIQGFVGYLIAEHGLDRAKQWKVFPDGRLEEVTPE